MLTQRDIIRLLELYDLGQAVAVRPASQGNVNETAFVETTEGRFVARRNERKLGRADQKRRHALMAWLAERHFPAPVPIPARDGATTVELDGRLYEVCAFIEGSGFAGDRPCQQWSTGSLLARYHAAAAGFPAGETPPASRYSPSVMPGLIERLLERDMMGDLYDDLVWYDLRAARLRGQLPEARYAGLPHLVIHGDIHADNLLYHGDEAIALLDYDQISLDARTVDIADALIAFATGEPPRGWSPWGVFNGMLDSEGAVRLLSGYVALEVLSVDELDSLPAMVEVAWLQAELRRVLLTPEGAPDFHQEVLGQGRQLSAWMQEHGAELSRRLITAGAT